MSGDPGEPQVSDGTEESGGVVPSRMTVVGSGVMRRTDDDITQDTNRG